VARRFNPTPPYTLHPTPVPYPLLPAPFTLHPTPCTIHLYPTPYSMHPTRNPPPTTPEGARGAREARRYTPKTHTVHLEPYTLHPTP